MESTSKLIMLTASMQLIELMVSLNIILYPVFGLQEDLSKIHNFIINFIHKFKKKIKRISQNIVILGEIAYSSDFIENREYGHL